MKANRMLAAAVALAAAVNPVSVPVSAADYSPVSASFADSYGDVVSGADYTIMVRLSGKYVTASQSGNVEQQSRRGGDSQIWHIESVGGDKCRIVSASDHSMAMTVDRKSVV